MKVSIASFFWMTAQTQGKYKCVKTNESIIKTTMWKDHGWMTLTLTLSVSLKGGVD